MKKYFYLLLALFHIGCGAAIPISDTSALPNGQAHYRFEEVSIFPNRYHLTINNKSQQALIFNAGDAANFLTFEDGKTIPITGRSVTQLNLIDGGFVLRPGSEGKLQFDIPTNDIRQAVTITFKGVTMVNRMTSLDYWVADRELIVMYDVRTAEFSVEDGEKINQRKDKI